MAQRRMERAMLGISRLDKVRNEEIAKRTRLPRVTRVAWKRKVNWAWKVANAETSKWSRQITEWCPFEYKRSRGRPVQRWEDELKQMIEETGASGATWMRKARCPLVEWTRIMTPAKNGNL